MISPDLRARGAGTLTIAPDELPAFSLVVFVGLQASGKTSFFRRWFGETHTHVSKDDFRNARHRDRRQLRLLEEALRAGRGVVLDNTNPTRSDRAQAIATAKQLRAVVVGFYFESRIAACRERNAGRAGDARVPEVALRATAARLERPSYDEGFHRLWYVRATNGTFLIEDWNEDEDR